MLLQDFERYLNEYSETLGRFLKDSFCGTSSETLDVILSNSLAKTIPTVVFERLKILTLKKFLSNSQQNRIGVLASF